ncbi:hypothetical protein CcaverHIS002_0113440 [Cutaneotrichosporon cavernicola]|uniref:Protein CPL1-like domain-containing protein n=1 Tax=Cutaneotrichosporon cavernicola TaxID=279322 RepID=A0AA48L2E2_9TREE|nr:uncharacterized protein CcaverHIS019_0113310 [Cutaneotrichosporon cavernicola]BEI80815.1 hypothetical protein CcaverHIS002_0113440 [Cutaneotrichosporon cavernicola]BEI88613.1 hypothetical protein CcaverHIS019_0113310 [Cutaneotrichosporon cavernicola]BEI96386.1 hypothetical protein CcaverHIS631_0113350 [Cutaneotrichosporon cavernicola]BEJ04158.1 hypothetical protein CcaverHIS641_0113330 [Cutaneotrichosporon cavernicola]
MRWFLVALLSLASLAQADIYASCGGIGTLGGDGLLPGLVGLLTGTLTTLVGTTLSGASCRSICAQQGYKFMVYAQGIDVTALSLNLDSTLGSCYCDNEGLDRRAIMEGAGATGACDTSILNLVGVKAEYIAATDLVFGGCYATNPTAINTFAVASQADCFAACGGNKQVSMRVSGMTEQCGLLGGLVGALFGGRSGGTWQCSCSNTAPTGQMVNCNSITSESGTCLLGGKTRNFAWNVYNRDVTPSGLRRRREFRPRVASETYCPLPKLACHVPGTGSFECLDTATELEACGGCPSGNFIDGVVSGTDCTSLPGVAMNRISCISGQCVASACHSNYDLINGECVFRIRK